MDLAIIKTGGKQYKVQKGDKIKIDKITGKEGSDISFETLMIADDKGAKVDIGKPKLTKKVTGKIIKHDKEKKITVIKYKSKIRYRKKQGFTKLFTLVEITKIA